MKNLIRQSCILFLTYLMAGCSLLSPNVVVKNQYLLNKIPCDVPVRKTHRIVLLVATPTARPVYDTTEMAYSLRPYQISYFSKNEWGETPGEMLQPLIVQTLQNTHYFKEIVVPPYAGNYNYALNTEVLALRQDFSHKIPCLIMRVRVQVTKMPLNNIIATKQFTIAQPFEPKSPYGGVFAANLATQRILERIAVFSLKVMR